MFSGLLSDEVHENIFWPDLPYVTDENGSKLIDIMVMLLVPWIVWYYVIVLKNVPFVFQSDIYFQVKNDEDILQTLTAEDTLVV